MLQLVDKAAGASIIATNMMMTARGLFCQTCNHPTANELAKIAIMTLKTVECLV
jgi:phosphotransacetylase